MTREGVDKLDNFLGWHIVSSKDTSANTNAILPGGGPVELLHTTITNERSVQCGEVITCDYNWNTGIFLLVLHTGELDIGGIIGNVHKGRVDHLVVDGVLGGPTHPTRSCI